MTGGSDPAAISIREEVPTDRARIRALNAASFGREDEAALVDSLRSEGVVIASLLASEGTNLVGHILFTELPITAGARRVRGAALAPMAVEPERQRLGIGARLVRAGIELCRERGVEVVVVLGHADYYPRFGFSAATAKALRAPFSGDAFMALELRPGALEGEVWEVRYAGAFGLDPA